MSGLLYRVRFRRDHRWAPRHMSAFLDGEFAFGRRTRMERHAEQCPECRRLLAGLRRLLSALRRLPPASGGAEGREIAASVRLRLREPPAL
jgi:anti-sigma factor RsiW